MKNIYPIGDIKPHYGIEDCHCKPIVEIDGEEIIVRHRAFDGRMSPDEAELENRDAMGMDVLMEILIGVRCVEHHHYVNEEGNHIDNPPMFIELQLPNSGKTQ